MIKNATDAPFEDAERNREFQERAECFERLTFSVLSQYQRLGTAPAALPDNIRAARLRVREYLYREICARSAGEGKHRQAQEAHRKAQIALAALVAGYRPGAKVDRDDPAAPARLAAQAQFYSQSPATPQSKASGKRYRNQLRSIRREQEAEKRKSDRTI